MIKFGLTRVTAPTARPISVSELKSWGRIDSDADDAFILNFCIDPALALLEGRNGLLGMALEEQTWDLTIDRFPFGADALRIPLPPLRSVTSITYIDENGTQQTWSSSNYRVDIASRPGRIEPAYGTPWPSARAIVNAATIRFVCGHALSDTSPTETTVPADVKLCVMAVALFLYENRARISGGATPSLPPHILSMIHNARITL